MVLQRRRRMKVNSRMAVRKSVKQADGVSQYTSLEKTASAGEKTESAVDEVPSVCFGTDVLTGAEVRWPLTIKGNPHLLVAGLPGMGKTTCLLNLCKQMLAAGIRPIVFSYHQDIDESLEHLVGSVRFIDFPDWGSTHCR